MNNNESRAKCSEPVILGSIIGSTSSSKLNSEKMYELSIEIIKKIEVRLMNLK